MLMILFGAERLVPVIGGELWELSPRVVGRSKKNGNAGDRPQSHTTPNPQMVRKCQEPLFSGAPGVIRFGEPDRGLLAAEAGALLVRAVGDAGVLVAGELGHDCIVGSGLGRTAS